MAIQAQTNKVFGNLAVLLDKTTDGAALNDHMIIDIIDDLTTLLVKRRLTRDGEDTGRYYLTNLRYAVRYVTAIVDGDYPDCGPDRDIDWEEELHDWYTSGKEGQPATTLDRNS